jgi:hypothetical protein
LFQQPGRGRRTLSLNKRNRLSLKRNLLSLKRNVLSLKRNLLSRRRNPSRTAFAPR